MGMEGLDDLAGKKAEDMSPEEQERLLSDPRIRELQYKLRNGGEKFKLECTNQKPQEIKNICIPEGATEEQQMEALQAAMREDQDNKDRTKKQDDARAAKALKERIKNSDVWCYVVEGAGFHKVNGTYHRNGESIRNGARVYMVSQEGVEVGVRGGVTW